MNINWDMSTYNKMSVETQTLCDAAKKWLLQNSTLSTNYVSRVQDGHPAIWFSRVMTNVEEAIDKKEQNAVDLGCRYVIHAQKAPFGKIHKSNVLVRLKRNKELISSHYLQQLSRTLEKLEQMKYPPREVRELSKLLESFI